jgi:sugar phosphate permease
LSKASKNWFPLTMRPLAQGLIATLCGRGGGAACFLVFGGLLLGYLQVPWRVAVMLLAGLGIVAGILFVVLFRNSPRVHPWANDAEANLVTHGDPEAAFTTRSRLNWRALLRNRSAQLLCTRSVLSNLADVLYVYWLPTYLRSILDVSAVSTGWMAALPLIGGALGGVASGGLQSYMMRRTGSRRWSRAAIGMAGKGIAGMLMLAVLGLQDAASIALLLLAVKFFCDWEQSAEWGVTGDLGGRSAATLFACINTAGAIGGFIAGPLNGYVLQSYSENGVPTAEGWNVLFVLIALEYLAAALCWLGIDGRTPLAPAEDRG